MNRDECELLHKAEAVCCRLATIGFRLEIRYTPTLHKAEAVCCRLATIGFSVWKFDLHHLGIRLKPYVED